MTTPPTNLQEIYFDIALTANMVIVLFGSFIAIFLLIYNRYTTRSTSNLDEEMTDPIHMWFVVFWCVVLASNIAQGLSASNTLLASLLFGVSIPAHYGIAVIYHTLVNQEKFPHFKVLSCTLAIYIFGACLALLGFPFKLHAFWIAVSSATPILFVVARRIKFSNASYKIFKFILIIYSLHLLDFPFLRFNDFFAPIGFSIVSLCLIAITVCFPMAISDFAKDRYSQKLEKQVASRTKKIQKQSELLRETFQQKENLLRMLCHDLSNPASTIFASTLLLKKKNIKGSLGLGKILDSQYTAIASVSEIIEIARLMEGVSSGKIELEKTMVHLSSIIEKTKTIFRSRLQEKKLSLECDMQAEKVLASESVLSNIIINNIVSNAIKFSEPKSKIELSSRHLQNDKVEISVRDFGTGMPKERLEKIFSDTEKTTTNGTSGEKGTGFGMPIVKNFVSVLGGEILIESYQEKKGDRDPGTKVTVILDSFIEPTSMG